MSQIAHGLARRAYDVAQGVYVAQKEGHGHSHGHDGSKGLPELPVWGVALLVATGVLYFLMMATVSYTYGNVVATLAMVESPSAQVDIRATRPKPNEKSEPSEKEALLDDITEDIEVLVTQQQPVTSTLRRAVHHITAIGGRWARFRGLQVALVYAVMKCQVVKLLMFAVGPAVAAASLPTSFAISLLTSVILVQFSMTWTHTVISMPSSKPWYRRIPAWTDAKHTILPTLFLQLVRVVSSAMPLFLIASGADMITDPAKHLRQPQRDTTNDGPGHHSPPPPPEDPSPAMLLHVQRHGVNWLLTGLASAVLLYILVVIPAKVVLHRVQASLLPASEETLVPFDRTFDGKVASSSEGSKLGMLDAWRTFPRSSRARLLKIYAKVFAIQTFAAFIAAGVLLVEVRMMLGRKEFCGLMHDIARQVRQ